VTDLGWFTVFALIFVVMVAVSGWMVWFSRRTMRSQKSQIEDMIREMRESIEAEGKTDSGRQEKDAD
jgi:hypothetical protein